MTAKRFLSLFLALMLSLSLFSCDDGEPMLSHAELRMPLPEGYFESESDVYDALYSNGVYMIALTRISFVAGMLGEGIPETLTDVEFAELYLEKCSRDAEIKTDVVTYAEYFDVSGSNEYYYLEAFYRSRYAYFAILFVSDADASEAARTDFLDFAKSVYFTNDR